MDRDSTGSRGSKQRGFYGGIKRRLFKITKGNSCVCETFFRSHVEGTHMHTHIYTHTHL